jgi:hypothetical protein
MIREPASHQRLSTPAKLRQYARNSGMTPAAEAADVATVLGLDGPEDTVHREQIAEWLQAWFADLEDPACKAKFVGELGPRAPMISLRDVEASAPIHD